MSLSLPVRAALRDMWSMRLRLLAVMLILGAGLGMYAGIYSAIDSLFETRDRIYREAGMAGYELRFSPEDVLNLPDWSDLPGADGASPRLLLPGNIELAGGRRLSALLVAADTAAPVNRLLLAQGTALDPARPETAVIDRNLARHQGLRVGDRLVVNVGRDRLELTVGGIATSAEHLIDGADPSFFLPAKGSLGVVFVPLELMDKRLGFRLVNSVPFAAPAPGVDLPEETQAALEARGRRTLTVEEHLPLSRQFGHLFLTLDLNAFRIFTPAIVVIFAASGTVILFFLLFQWVERQRRELGVLDALGYSALRRGARVLVPLVPVTLGGLLAGLGFAYLLLYGFGLEYAGAVGLPSPDLRLVPGHFVAGGAGMALACLIGALVPLSRALRVTSIAAVRDLAQVPPAHHGTAANGIRDIAWRHALRAVLRRRRASLTTTLAVALAIAPALSYFVSLRSFEQGIVDGFANDRWNYSVDFLSPVWDDELAGLRALPGVSEVDPIVRGALSFAANGVREGALLIGVDPARALRQVEIVAGRGLAPEDRDAVTMESKLARSLRLQVGDRVQVEARLGPQTAHLVGIFSGALPGESFTTREAARRWLDLTDQSTGVLVAAQPEAGDLSEILYRDTRVGKVTERYRLVAEVVHHLHEIAAIVYLAAAFSIGVALLFLYTSTAFAFLEREGDYALLELLGFPRAAVAAMVRRELWLIGGVGVALSIPLGYALSHWLNGVLGEAWFAIPTTFNIIDPLALSVPALALLPLVAWPVVRRIRAQDPALVLRRRSFG